MSPAALPFSGGRPVALVTGGAVRVGRAICLELARRGCDVLLTRRTSAEEADETAAAISRLGTAAHVAELDLVDSDAAAEWAASVARDLPRLDVLVHSASTYDPSPLDGLVVADAERQLRVNALSPLAISSRLAPLLSRSDSPGGGVIVAMLDIHALDLPRKGYAAYEMSKAALGAMVRALARELAPAVRVNGVAPGVVAWPEDGEEADPEKQRQYVARVPLARSGTPEEAAAAVAFLALDATYTTGDVLTVDGGRSLR